jgi:hypothetical protein
VRVLEHTLGMQTPIEILTLVDMGDSDRDIPGPSTGRAEATQTPPRCWTCALTFRS